MHLSSRAESCYGISEMGCWWEWILNKVPSAKQVVLSATDLMRPISWGFALHTWILHCLIWWRPWSKLFSWMGHSLLLSCGVSLPVAVLNQIVPGNISGHLNSVLCTVKLSEWCLAQCRPVPIAVSQMAPEHSLGTSFGQGLFQQLVCIWPPCFGGQEHLVLRGMGCSLPAALNGRKWSWKI